MGELTQKEWICLSEYVKDLLEDLKQNNEIMVSDQRFDYTKKELTELHIKILNKLI